MSAIAFGQLLNNLVTNHQYRQQFFNNPAAELNAYDFTEQEKALLAKDTLVLSIQEVQLLIGTNPQSMVPVLADQAKHSYCCTTEEPTEPPVA